MEERAEICTPWTGAVALRGSERAKGRRERKGNGKVTLRKVPDPLLANSQTYSLGALAILPPSLHFL